MFIVFSKVCIYIYTICLHIKIIYAYIATPIFPSKKFAVFSSASQLLCAFFQVGPEVLLLTDDRACKAKAVNDGLVALRAAVAW